MRYDDLSRRAREEFAKLADLEVPVEFDLDIELPPEPVWLVAGSIKSGKSSLINDLLGEQLLPDVRPITDTRTYGRVRRGPPGTATLVFNDGDTQPITLEEARSLLSKEEPEDPLLGEIDRVELFTDAQVVAALSLEDSPGLGDARIEDRFVRQDVADRAFDSTAVLYLIAGSALPGETDAEFLTPVIKAGVPVRVLFSRFDQVDDDDTDDDPRIVRIKALRRWRIDLPPDRIHFISSYLHRSGQPEQGGVDKLSTALTADGPHAAARVDAQGARLLARRLDEGLERLDQVLEEMARNDKSDHDRAWLKTRRAGTRQLNHAVAAFQELQVACTAAEKDAVFEVRSACESRRNGLHELWRTTWGPAFGKQLAAAAGAFDAAFKDIEEAPIWAQPLPVPSPPVLALLDKPSDLDVSVLDMPLGGGWLKAGKQVLEEIRLLIWIQENVDRTSAGVHGAVEQLVHAAGRRIDLLNDVLRDALEELEDDLAANRERRRHQILCIRRELDRIREETRRHGRLSI